MLISRLFIVFLLACGALAARAATPLMVGSDGRPLIWDSTQPIAYTIDEGNLGRLNNSQAAALIAEALRIWTDVPGTGLHFTFAGTATATERTAALQPILAAKGHTIEMDDSNDFGRLLGKGISTAAPTIHFIFDNDGSLINTLTHDDNVSGIALNLISGDRTAIVGSVILINGLLIDGSDTPKADQRLSDVLAVIMHEIGHTLGLDHTVVNAGVALDVARGVRPLSDIRFIPTMFPIYLIGTGDAIVTLHPDDISALQWLYNAADRPSVRGVARTAANAPIIGLHAIARATASPLCQAVGQITGATCPYFLRSGCTTDNAGAFTIPLPRAEAYDIALEAIDPAFGTALSLQRYGHYNVALPTDANITDVQSNVTTAVHAAVDLPSIDDPDCPLNSGIDVAFAIGADEPIADALESTAALPTVMASGNIPDASAPNEAPSTDIAPTVNEALLPTDDSQATAPLEADLANIGAASGGCALLL